MRKMINIRNSIIILLCVTILCMAVGFIVLSVEFDKIKKEDIKYDVVIDSYSKVSSTKGGGIEPSGAVDVTSKRKEIEMEMTLNTAHDEVTYSILIKNEGNVDAVIVDLIESPDYKEVKFANMIDPVTINHNDIIGKELKPGEVVELKVNFYYNPSTLEGRRSFKYKLGLITESK